MLGYFKQDHFNYARIVLSIQSYYEDLSVIREIRGVIEHSDNENDFEITDICLEETKKGIAFHQPYFQYPANIEIKGLSGVAKEISLKGVTVLDLMNRHFWAIHNICESLSVFPLMKNLDAAWQPRQIAMQHFDPKCPVQWMIEPAEKLRRTVNHPPT